MEKCSNCKLVRITEKRFGGKKNAVFCVEKDKSSLYDMERDRYTKTPVDVCDNQTEFVEEKGTS